METKKKQRNNPTDRSDLLDRLPDDLVISILCKLTSTALSPSYFFAVLITCKRLKRLGLHPLVLNRAGAKMLAIKARNWCKQAHRFLRRCVRVGNVDACYILGMIRFYCLENRPGGLSLMAKAAIKSHTLALYSLAIIHLNGSGGDTKSNKDLRAGVVLVAHAASLGHADALREFGHCLQDGYGVCRSAVEGRRFLLQATAHELASNLHGLRAFAKSKTLLSEIYSYSNMVEESHPVNKFLVEWFRSRGLEPGLSTCSYMGCGRPETRVNEYRKCLVCEKAKYCSRGCQSQDWKMRHKVECTPLDQWDLGLFVGALDGGDGLNDDVGDDRVAEVGDLVSGASLL